MKFTSVLVFLPSMAFGAALQSRDYAACATVTPFLAPLCQITDTATKLLCDFPALSLTAGKCQDVTYECAIHPPTSFVAQLDAPSSQQCYVAVFPNFGCKGDEVDSGTLSTAQSTCIEAPYFGKALNGGLLSSGLLPFGFKSAKLVCR